MVHVLAQPGLDVTELLAASRCHRLKDLLPIGDLVLLTHDVDDFIRGSYRQQAIFAALALFQSRTVHDFSPLQLFKRVAVAAPVGSPTATHSGTGSTLFRFF